MPSLFVLIFALSMIACGDGDRRPENQSSNPLYPSGSEQVQRGQIVTGEGSVVSEAEVVIIDAERLVVLARAPVDDQPVARSLCPRDRATGWAFPVPI